MTEETLKILNEIQEEIDKVLQEPQYYHEGEDWQNGLIIASNIIDEYIFRR